MDIRLNYMGIPDGEDDGTTVEGAISATSPISSATTSSSYYHHSGQARHGSHSQHFTPQYDLLASNNVPALDWPRVLDHPALSLSDQHFLASIPHPPPPVTPLISQPFVPNFWESGAPSVPSLEAPEHAVVDLTNPQTQLSPPRVPVSYFYSQPSQGLTSNSQLSQPPPMPPAQHHRQQSRRPSRTTAPTSTVAPAPQAPADERAPKRRRLSGRRSNQEKPHLVKKETETEDVEEIEELDLTEVNGKSDLSKAISKQQQDAVAAQMKVNASNGFSGRTPLSSYKCPICMDTPEDATTTICGHLFCHKCIIDTLRFSEQQRQDDGRNQKAKGTCPVCRKPLARKDESGSRRTLVPLEIKMVKRKDLKGKAVADRVGTLSQPAKVKTDRETSLDMWTDLTTLNADS